jgi:hypothetical protein
MKPIGGTQWLVLAMAGAMAGSTSAARAAGFEVRSPLLVSERYVELANAFGQDDVLHQLARDLNLSLKLPVALGLRYAECGEANAQYHPGEREIRLCLELVERLADDFGARLDDDRELAAAVAGANLFIVLHEAGHALVDVLELPITGREEDAVDQLSAWLLIGDEAGDVAVLSAATAFSMAGDERGVADGDFADAHSLDQQRYFNMVCWVYGSAPDTHSDLPRLAGLPLARANGCAEEFARLHRSWSRLLDAYRRQPDPQASAARSRGRDRPDASGARADIDPG